MTPGSDQKYGNGSKEIINGFLRDYMKLYDGDVWRKWYNDGKQLPVAAAARPRPEVQRENCQSV